MTTTKFKPSMKEVLVFEGGKVNDPHDPGGKTNQGVTQRTFSSYLSRIGHPPRDVYSMVASERDAIYKSQYWDAIWGDKLPAGIDFVVFDGAVNSGPKQSIKWLQRALGSLYQGTIDGVMGNQTMAAVLAHDNHDFLVAEICRRRIEFLQSLRTYKHYGRGWLKRVNHVEVVGQAWASGKNAPVPRLDLVSTPKADIADAKNEPSTAPADTAIGAGSITTVLSQAVEALKPLSVSAPSLSQIIMWLTIAGVVVTVAGLAYRWWVMRRKTTLNEKLGTE